MPPPRQRRQQPRFDPNRGSSPPEMIDLVDAGWILKALGGMLALALVCAYITLCILYAHNQWQLVLKPSRTVSATPASLNLPFTEVHFGVTASSQPQLDGWWIPSAAASDPTALILHSGDGTMADALPQALTLHQAGLNVLLFDYRGFGRSDGQHPTQSFMQQDAESALAFLESHRTMPSGSILIFGSGVGASLAVKLCADHSNIPALILESPDGDFASRARADSRSSLVPASLLFNQLFPLADPLHTLATPKLLISFTKESPPTVLERAADPKTTLELPARDDAALHKSLMRFLGTYLTRPAPELLPNP
jgi:pimeloyl-ACP methyl ester carboxylesterase